MTEKEAREIVGGKWADLDKTIGDYREAKGYLECFAQAAPLVEALKKIKYFSVSAHPMDDLAAMRYLTAEALSQWDEAQGAGKSVGDKS